MRLPTLAGLTAATRRVAERFPEVTVVALSAAVFGHLSIGHDPFHPSRWPAWWAAAGLGISAFLAVAITTERLHPAGAGRMTAPRIAGDLAVATLLVAFALSWPQWSDAVRVHRLLQVALALHLLVAFAPFLGRREPNAFWQHNRILFVRFLTAALFSAVLFVGLAIALASAKPLFGLRVPERTYFDLWFAIAFVFNTGYLLAGVPEDLGTLEADTTYPGGLKVFAQLILVPLVAVYLVILTAYLVKVLVTGQWPKGWIGWLVSSVSAAGLLSLLLVHPVRDRAENRWIGTYARWFYLALIPSVAMLFAAIGKRIGQYGFTEDRYFLLALACWIAVIAVGYTLRRAADIRWIPISLCALAVATALGPWGAYSVSRADQTGRLMRALRRHGVIGDAGPALPAPRLGLDERKELSSGIAYLAGTHGVAALPPVLRALASPDTAKQPRYGRGDEVAQEVMRALGLGYVSQWQSVETRSVFFHSGSFGGHVEDVAGFDVAVSLEGQLPMGFEIDGVPGTLGLDRRRRCLTATAPWGEAWTFPLDSTLRRLEIEGSPRAGIATQPPIRLAPEDDDTSARLVLNQLNVTVEADTLANVNLGGVLYLARPGTRLRTEPR